MSHHNVTDGESRFLREALKADFVSGSIRLREGEYQYELAKAIGSFQLQMSFPDVKDIIKRLYGEDKADDIQFVRKIQTILKKMEKSSIVRILPKKTPWELQKYSLTGFRFEDNDKNRVVFATNDEIRQSQSILDQMTLSVKSERYPFRAIAELCALSGAVFASYAVILWTLVQPVIDPLLFIPAFLFAVLCSVLLGRTLSNRNVVWRP